MEVGCSQKFAQGHTCVFIHSKSSLVGTYQRYTINVQKSIMSQSQATKLTLEAYGHKVLRVPQDYTETEQSSKNEANTQLCSQHTKRYFTSAAINGLGTQLDHCFHWLPWKDSGQTISCDLPCAICW